MAYMTSFSCQPPYAQEGVAAKPSSTSLVIRMVFCLQRISTGVPLGAWVKIAIAARRSGHLLFKDCQRFCNNTAMTRQCIQVFQSICSLRYSVTVGASQCQNQRSASVCHAAESIPRSSSPHMFPLHPRSQKKGTLLVSSCLCSNRHRNFRISAAQQPRQDTHNTACGVRGGAWSRL